MDQGDEERSAARLPWWAVVAGALACACFYLGLVHPSFYKTDGPDIARLLDAHLQFGEPLQHPWHVGYLPALDGFRRLLASVGIVPDYLQLGGWFSALGAAVGFGFAVASMSRLLGRAAVGTAALALALCPGVILFATVVEYHGPLLAPLGLAFWWTAVQVGRPTWWGMLALGGLGHVAFLMHGQAVFYPVWLLAFFVARRWPQRTVSRDLALAAVAAVTHALLWFVLPRLWPVAYGMWADLGKGMATEASTGRPQSLDYTPLILWQEWLWPLLPVSVLVFAAPFVRALRLEFAAFVLGFLPFLYVSVRQLVFEPEYGAYLLPMVLPACLLVGQIACGRWRRGVHALLLLGLLPILIDHRAHFVTQRAFDDQFAFAVMNAANGAEPFVLVGSHRELAAAFARLGVPARKRDPLREERFLWVRHNATLLREQATPELFAGVEGYLRALHGAGRAVLITGNALRSLDDPAAAMLAERPTLQVPGNETLAGPLLAQHLRARFELVPAGHDMLRLVPKP